MQFYSSNTQAHTMIIMVARRTQCGWAAVYVMCFILLPLLTENANFDKFPFPNEAEVILF